MIVNLANHLWSTGRVRTPPPRTGRVPTLTCTAEECGELTKHGKPFCCAHIMLGAYAQEVRRGLAERDMLS